ncbi:signal recognition particle-docking protein FtsY [Hydrogenispora ethanolica]|uniref:Signal recognition particle receptor FtsY n=1 Tax=Hydrogenispora ethanolica TaxID=1082276 RepID=A0A4R1QZ99_HYDET|nr:signal recognition particle-docking protein FtsY [Hydrogenispora ethanolica]TCL58306.1 signal recognition particle-docking protein FtsY [Hydrogenispora ethanolica]
MAENNKGLFARLKEGLSKTKNSLVTNLEGIFSSYQKIDEELFTELEDTLIMADVGVETTTYLTDQLRETVKQQKVSDPAQLKPLLIGLIRQVIEGAGRKQFNFDARDKVLLIVGVNGVGKTTTIAKLAARFSDHRRQVLLVAADTFRAAATEQLMQWGERIGVPVIHHQEGADPAAVVFDGMAAAQSRKSDLVIVDTAGRLHTKVNLMEELKKVRRIITQNIGGRQLETLLVLDATTGQNAVNQVKVFKEAVAIDGIVLTKLDGTAKGGVVLAIAHQFQIPIYLIGVGEKKEDLQEFDALAFTRALFE